MSSFTFVRQGKIQKAEFAVREDYSLAVTLTLETGVRTLVFHDFVRKAGKKYMIFHEKTLFRTCGNTVELRTSAMHADTGAPVPGLLVNYRFDFNLDMSAFYVSAGYNSDSCLSGCGIKLMDITWEGWIPQSFTGYEWDAEGKPFAHTFTVPREKNPEIADYNALMRMDPHVAWEKMKTRPHTFTGAVAVEGKKGYIAVYGGTPTYHPESEYVEVFREMGNYSADVRFFSGENCPGAWFILEKPADFFATMAQLDDYLPVLPEQVLVAFEEEEIHLKSGTLQVKLLRTPGGVWVSPITPNGKTAGQPYPLFYLSLYDTIHSRTLELDAGAAWDKITTLQRDNYIRITFSNPDGGKVENFIVEVEGFLTPTENRIVWRARAINRSNRWSLLNLGYPTCVTHGFRDAFNPYTSGVVKRDFNRRSCVYKGRYPSGTSLNMPYTAVYNPAPMGCIPADGNGIYVGVHDSEGVPKFLTMAGAPSGSTIVCWTGEPTYQKRPGNSFTLPGEMVWQRFGGDWYDATAIYRSFVYEKATWLSPLRGRTDMPQWMRRMPVWIMHFMPNENPDANPFPITLREQNPDADPADWYRTAVRFREEIGVPVAYHLYNWHWVPFNNDNPHYFPTHHDLKAGMRELKKADIRVIPYIAGYSWDMCDNRGDDYRFLEEALPNTAKDLNAEPVYASYASIEPTGQRVRFARMCPTTTLWKNEINQICKKLHSDFGMDGIYLDVVSTSYTECCDENHLHEPGYGSFWRKAYGELIAGLRADAPDDFAVVSEATSEVYTGMLDGMLSWFWVQPDSVPALASIYDGYTNLFGRVITQNKRNDAGYFKFMIAQSLVYGQQLGWIHPEIVNDPVQFPFLKKMAQLRYENAEFFCEGIMLRPPLVDGQLELLDTEPNLRGQVWHHDKLVVAGGFEDAKGQRKLFVVNAGSSAAEVAIRVYAEEYRLPDNLIQFTEEVGLTLVKVETSNGISTLHCQIAPEGYGVLTWK